MRGRGRGSGRCGTGWGRFQPSQNRETRVNELTSVPYLYTCVLAEGGGRGEMLAFSVAVSVCHGYMGI